MPRPLHLHPDRLLPADPATRALTRELHASVAGFPAGYGFVHEAVADPAICAWMERLMRDEETATITPAKGQTWTPMPQHCRRALPTRR